jgi:hypothetical protein
MQICTTCGSPCLPQLSQLNSCIWQRGWGGRVLLSQLANLPRFVNGGRYLLAPLATLAAIMPACHVCAGVEI